MAINFLEHSSIGAQRVDFCTHIGRARLSYTHAHAHAHAHTQRAISMQYRKSNEKREGKKIRDIIHYLPDIFA
jgi:hypothetical protein